MLGLLNIGTMELLLLVAAAVLLFGGDLPDVARRAGKTLARLRRVARDLSDHVYREEPFSFDDEPPRLAKPPREIPTRDTEVEVRKPGDEPTPERGEDEEPVERAAKEASERPVEPPRPHDAPQPHDGP